VSISNIDRSRVGVGEIYLVRHEANKVERHLQATPRA
jgi:hypothetical protein